MWDTFVSLNVRTTFDSSAQIIAYAQFLIMVSLELPQSKFYFQLPFESVIGLFRFGGHKRIC